MRSALLTASTSARPSFVSSPSQLRRNGEPFYRWVILVSDKADESRPASESRILFRRMREVEKFMFAPTKGVVESRQEAQLSKRLRRGRRRAEIKGEKECERELDEEMSR